MEFCRAKKRGQRQKATRTWLSSDYYRVVWRKEVFGICVPASFQASVRILVPYSDGTFRESWDYVNRRRRLIKTLKAAIEECERHHRLWTQVIEATSIRALKELFGGKLPLGLPLWVRKKLDRRLYAILIDNRPMKHCSNDAEDESCTESLPRSSDASGPGGPIKAPLEGTSQNDTSVLRTEKPAKTRKKPAKHNKKPTKPRACSARKKKSSLTE